MSTRLWGRPTGASPIVSARHSSFPRAWSPNEARWEPRRGVIPELLLDRTALRGRRKPAHRLDETLIARGRWPPQKPLPQPVAAGFMPACFGFANRSLLLGMIQLRDLAAAWRGGNDLTVGQHIHAVISGRIHVT